MRNLAVEAMSAGVVENWCVSTYPKCVLRTWDNCSISTAIFVWMAVGGGRGGLSARGGEVVHLMR